MEPGETAGGARARELAVARLELKAAAARRRPPAGRGAGRPHCSHCWQARTRRAAAAGRRVGASSKGGACAGNGRWLKTDAPLVVLDLEGRRLGGRLP